MNYFILINSHRMGPLTEKQILSLMQSGHFDRSALVSIDGEHWHSFEEFPIFRENMSGLTSPEKTPQPVPMSPQRGRKNHKVLIWVTVIIALLLAIAYGAYVFLNKEDIKPKKTLTLAEVFEKHRSDVGLVTYTIQNNQGQHGTVNLGTAFAISNTLFVTNAHVAFGIKTCLQDFLFDDFLDCLEIEAKKQNLSFEQYCDKLGEESFNQQRNMHAAARKTQGWKVRDIEIRLNHSNGKSYRIKSVRVHPKYHDNQDQRGEYDVAILEIDGETDSHFEIASKDELHDLKVGTQVASAGFPTEGLGINIEKPEASYASDDIKKLTDFDDKDSGPEYNRWLTVGIPIAGGASGSPVFTSDGKVVAVIWGLAGNGRGKYARIGSSAQQTFAVRIDQLDDVMNATSVPWKEWVLNPLR